MVVYTVGAKSIGYVEVLVEAENEEQAREIAEQLDGGDFYEYGGDWEWGDAFEVTVEDVKNWKQMGREIWSAKDWGEDDLNNGI